MNVICSIKDVVNMSLTILQSVIFTGVYGYAIGVLCLLCGIVYGSFLAITLVCQRNDRRVKKVLPCNYKSCGLSIPLAILLTTFAM